MRGRRAGREMARGTHTRGLRGAALAAMLVLAVACALSSPPVAPPTPAVAPRVDVVRLAWEDVGVPTPFRVSTAGPGGAVLLSLIYDTLTWKDEHGLIPWLATRWEVSPDGREYTFTLARGVRWQDGQPLTSDDVAFSFGYYAQHPYRWMSTAMVESATVVGPDQVRVRLREPYAPFLEDVAGVIPVIPKHVWAKVEDPTTYGGADASVGSGPFILAEYRSADGAYRLEANPSYFRGRVKVRELQQLNSSPATRIQAVQQGNLDLTFVADASVGALFEGDPRVKVLATPPLSIVRLAVNTERPPLDQTEVRQALAYALDRARIAQVVTKGAPLVGSAGVVPPETPWFDPDLRTYPFDPGQARTLLRGRSYTVELLAEPSDREPELLQPLLQAVGITLVTRRVDPATRTQLLREQRFQLALLRHIGIGGDPDFLRRWYSGEEANDFAAGSVFLDPRYDALGRVEATTLDPAQRKQAIFAMQQILADALPTIPLYYRRFYWLYDSTKLTPMNTWGGLMNGIPLVCNKLVFLER